MTSCRPLYHHTVVQELKVQSKSKCHPSYKARVQSTPGQRHHNQDQLTGRLHRVELPLL